jgi:hypothetical protein
MTRMMPTLLAVVWLDLDRPGTESRRSGVPHSDSWRWALVLEMGVWEVRERKERKSERVRVRL